MPRVSIPKGSQGKFPKPSPVKTSMPLQSKRPKQSKSGKTPAKPAF